MNRFLLLFLVLGWFAADRAEAQTNPDYSLRLSTQDVVVGSTTTVRTLLDNPSGQNLAGWSWGICHDSPAIEIRSVALGADSQALNGGSGPDFNAPAVLVGSGWTIGVAVGIPPSTSAVLSPGANRELHVATYSGESEGVVNLDYCVLGNPPVIISLVDSSGSDVSPMTSGNAIAVTGGTAPFRFIAPTETIHFDPATGSGSGTVALQIDENETSPTFPTETQGFSLALRHGPELTIEDPMQTADRGVRSAPILAAVNGGDGPDFFGANVTPIGGPGMTLGVVYALLGGAFLQFPDPTDVILVTFDTNAGLLVGQNDPIDVPLTWATDLGNPVVEPLVVFVGGSLGVELEDGAIQLVPVVDTPFIRGDCNDDGSLNVADGIFTLNALFLAGPTSDCRDACDANGDTRFDQADAIYSLNYRFLQGPPPPAPFPGCGVVPGSDCESFNSCF